jgi:hypothetical protein
MLLLLCLAAAAGQAAGQTGDALQAARQQARPAYNVVSSGQQVAAGTGFFRTHQIDGVWWLIDPRGELFYAIGTDHIRYEGHGCEALGYAPYGRNMQARYGSEERWAESTVERLVDWGFNLLGDGHTRRLRHRRFAHTATLYAGMNFASRDPLCPQTGWAGFPNVFSPDWPAHVDEFARRICAPGRDDPWLLGYFLDNELEWYGKNGQPWGLFDEAWKKPAGHSAKQAWLEWIRQHVAEAAEFEALWGIRVANWEELAAHTEPVRGRTERARMIGKDFVREVADRYFRAYAEAIRRHDPNHLILGTRFAGQAPGVWDIAGRYCDVVSFNLYPSVDLERGVPGYLVERFQDFHQQAGKPLMITEWSFPALDTHLPSTHGAGMRVDTQVQRATCFTHFQKLMFRLPFMVGSNYFMWVDEPELGISSSFPENSNYGLVNEHDEPYPELTQAARELHARVYDLRREAAVPPLRQDGWLVPWLREVPDTSVDPPDGPLRVEAGMLRLRGPLDGEAWEISHGDVLLGHLAPALRIGEPAAWAHPGSGRIVSIRRDARVAVVDMEFVGGSEAAAIGGYRCGWRFWIPDSRGKGPPWVAAQWLWVENTGQAAWRLHALGHWLRPRIGGSSAGSEPFDLGVHHYYRRGGGWIDRGAGLGIACWFPVDPDFWINYHRDASGNFYPELFRRVERDVAPGRRFVEDGPRVFFFPLHELSRQGFTEASFQIERNVLLRPAED